MRRVITSVVGIVLVGLTLILVTGRITAAAPPTGFSVEDFKGVYVGHFAGGSLLGLIRFTADGAGNVSFAMFPVVGTGCANQTTYDVLNHVTFGNGYLLFGDGHVQGALSDRGKTLDFVIDPSSCMGQSVAGTMTLQ